MDKLLDQYLACDFPKEMLTERKERLEQISANLLAEISDLTEHISQATITDDQLTYIEEFCVEIRGRLEQADFDTKRQLIELLDVRCKMDFEDGEKVIWLKCLIEAKEQQQVLRMPTSHSLNEYNRHPVLITARLVLQLINNLKIQCIRGELPITLKKTCFRLLRRSS